MCMSLNGFYVNFIVHTFLVLSEITTAMRKFIPLILLGFFFLMAFLMCFVFNCLFRRNLKQYEDGIADIFTHFVIVLRSSI